MEKVHQLWLVFIFKPTFILIWLVHTQLHVYIHTIQNLLTVGIKEVYSKDVMKTVARKLVSSLWGHVLQNLQENELREFIKRPTGLLHDAAKAGNVEFLILLISSHPYIAWEGDHDGKSIFHIAVENRLENVFKLIHEISVVKDFTTKYRTVGKEKYNMLHLAAKIASSNHLNRVSGAALQMQRELLWFKEVEKIVLPFQLEAKCHNDDPSAKLTPRELFTEEHKQLRKDGEKWMKSTANSCMLVATLIATVVFAAAFTIPGGSDDNTGTPIFLHKVWFTVFVIADVAALLTSSSSILMFLSMLTSRYAEEDFLHSLPSRLLLGLTLLFISIVCMVMAFSATFFILYHEAKICVPITIAAMAIVPVICCAFQFKLWVDTFHNTYMSRFLFKPRQHKFMFSSTTSLLVDLFRQLHKRKRERDLDVENREPKDAAEPKISTPDHLDTVAHLGTVTASHGASLRRNFKLVANMALLWRPTPSSQDKKVENNDNFHP